jgi:hypothetical protein
MAAPDTNFRGKRFGVLGNPLDAWTLGSGEAEEGIMASRRCAMAVTTVAAAAFAVGCSAGAIETAIAGPDRAAQADPPGGTLGSFVQPAVFELAQGYGGKLQKNGGTHEQGVVTQLAKNGKQYVVTVYMSPDVDPGLGYWQCKCSSFELTDIGPKVVADNVLLTQNMGGNRNCNRPAVASDGEHVLWTYGADSNYFVTPPMVDEDNTYLFAGVLDESCQHVVTPKKVSTTDDNDSGGSTLIFNGIDKQTGAARFTASYYYAGGRDAYAVGLELYEDAEAKKLMLDRTYATVAYQPTNIARQHMAAIDEGRTLYCGPYGNQRPPEKGVACVVLDAKNGQKLSEVMTIAKSDPDKDVYYNQPTLAALAYNRFAIQVLRSNGEGRKNNGKGSNIAELYVYEVTPDNTLVLKASQEKLETTFQTHSAICSGQYGVLDAAGDVDTFISVVSASPTGVGQAMMQMMRWSAEEGFVVDPKDKWIIAEYGDAGFESNMYGDNPGNQGRNFLTCLGSVANPGYGVEGGFMPGVRSLFVAPVNGKKPDQPKNSQFLSFIPGASDAPLAPQAPTPGGGGDGGPAPEVAPPSAGGPGETAGACSYAASPRSGVGALLFVVGLALAVARRRRAREE